MPGYGHRGIGRWDAVVDALDREGHNGYTKLARDAYIFTTISPVQVGQLLGLQAGTSPDPAPRIPKTNEHDDDRNFAGKAMWLSPGRRV